jgi:phosphoadenosine phosphosulfate reductase
VALASSLSAEDMVITDAIARLQLPIEVFVLNTGGCTPKPCAARGNPRALRHRINVYEPDPRACEQYVAPTGATRFYGSVELRKRCCEIRKVEPLRRALAGKRAWITGSAASMRRPRRARRERVRPRQRPAQVQPARRWSEPRCGNTCAAPGSLQPSLRPGLPLDRLRAVHAPVVAGEDRAPGAGGGKSPSTRSGGLHPRKRELAAMLAERSHLDWLESEAIYILREVAGQCQNPVLFFSGGKDSIVLLRWRRRRSARALPVPAAAHRHRHNYREVIEFRDRAPPSSASA